MNVVTLTPSPGKVNFLCLNMIVKDESAIIERLLESVLPIIDSYCICDTGSTDDTVARIRAYMHKAGKPGLVFSEPFQNFGYNRTVALDKAAEWGQYALLMDADMKLVITPEFRKESLCENGYSIVQKNGEIEYSNLRIVKTGIGVKCVGPTHEYYDVPGRSHKMSTLWIEDIGDGGSKADKFARDIRLLTEAVRLYPKQERNYFYLANSYKNMGKYEEAIQWYKSRYTMGGWKEEVFYTCYELGNCYRELKDMPNAVYWWMEGYAIHPKRSETVYELTKHYREQGNHALSQMFCTIGLSIPYPSEDVLFIKKDVYNFLFDYEQSILAYYVGKPVDHYTYLRLLGTSVRDISFHNYRFYVKKLKDFALEDKDFSETVVKPRIGCEDTFTSSTPCILAHSEGYLMNVRYVNYIIRPDGSYAFLHNDGKIASLQRTYWLNADLGVCRSSWIDEVQDPALTYQGVEDVKLFAHCGDICVLGTVEGPNNTIAVGHGMYKEKERYLTTQPFVSPRGARCEKNWCYFHTLSGDLQMVYSWNPLVIVQPKGNLVEEVSKSDTPAFFRDLRGSSNGCRVGNEVWFLCHMVHHSAPRQYYHLIVILDLVTLAYKRNSILFKFHGDAIEYALGFIVEPDRLIFSYSRMDRTSAVMTLRRDVAERELFPS